MSVIVPVYNEAEGLDAFHFRLRRALDLIPGIDSEIVYIDDGSTDQSRAVLQCIQSGDPCVLIVQLSRNFGKESALSAGFDVATGDALIVIDADLQDPPELIGSMIQEWRNGFDVVNMRRKSREGESAFKKLTAHLFYRTINRLSDVPIPPGRWRFSFGELSRSRCVAVDARALPVHEGAICLDRFPANYSGISSRGQACRHYKVEILGLVELCP